MKTVLITGVGAIMGYGMLRSIRKSHPDAKLIGTDIYSDAVGQAWADIFIQAPMTSDEGYMDWLYNVVCTYAVDLIIPGIEQDVHKFADEISSLEKFPCKVVLNDIELIGLTKDKLSMHDKLLEINDSSRIPSFIDGGFEKLSQELGVPFILKPRCSYASKGLVRVASAEDFSKYEEGLGHDLIAQPIIGTDAEEYTVGVFGDGLGSALAKISLKRKLAKDGSTASAIIAKDEDLDLVVDRLCGYFKPIGPTNLQFRKDDAGWKLLEINPRVSSTASIRSAFGFNEAAMCIDFYLYGILPVNNKVNTEGFAMRFIEDYIVYDRNSF